MHLQNIFAKQVSEMLQMIKATETEPEGGRKRWESLKK